MRSRCSTIPRAARRSRTRCAPSRLRARWPRPPSARAAAASACVVCGAGSGASSVLANSLTATVSRRNCRIRPGTGSCRSARACGIRCRRCSTIGSVARGGASAPRPMRARSSIEPCRVDRAAVARARAAARIPVRCACCAGRARGSRRAASSMSTRRSPSSRSEERAAVRAEDVAERSGDETAHARRGDARPIRCAASVTPRVTGRCCSVCRARCSVRLLVARAARRVHRARRRS